MAPRKGAKPVPADDKEAARLALAKLIASLDQSLDGSGEAQTRSDEAGELERVAARLYRPIRVDFEASFQVKASLAAMVKGRLIYIGPNVSSARIVLVTLCVLAVLAALFGGILALLHSGGTARP